MNITSIADIAGLEGKALVEKMVVTVKSAFDPSTKESEYGPYTVQNTVVEDDTGTIKCAFFDANINLKNFIGQQITLMSSGGKGVTTLDYNNKKTGSVERQIKASKYTVIDEVTGGGDMGIPTAQGQGTLAAPNGTVPAAVGSVPTRTTSAHKVNFVEDAEVKRASIERQKALEMAIEMVKPLLGGITASGKEITPSVVLDVAEKFYAFISGLGPEPKAEDNVLTDSSESEEVL